MKFRAKFLIIYIAASSMSFGQEAGDVNDFLLNLAKETAPSYTPKKLEEKDEALLDLSNRQTPAQLRKYNEEDDDALLMQASTNSFLLMGKEAFGFSQIKEVISTAEDIVFEYLGTKIDSKNKINLQIIPDSDEAFKEQFYVNSYADGSMYLMLRWDSNLKYEAFCKFIIGAMLRKIVLERSLVKDKYNIPPLLEEGLSVLLEQRSRKTFSLEVARKAKAINLLGLRELLNAGKIDKDIVKLSAYWNLLALKRFCKSDKELHSICAKFLAENNATETYTEISKNYKDGDFDKYFKCIVQYELSLRIAGVLAMEDSAEELLRLSFIRKDSRNLAFGDRDIFKHNEDKEVRVAIEKRIVEIKFLLAKINPIYFNALLSLGEMFEAALDDDEDKFENSRQNFITYFKEGKYLEFRTKTLLERQ